MLCLSGFELYSRWVPLYDDSSLAAIRHVQSIIPILRPCPNIRSHSVLLPFRLLFARFTQIQQV